MKTPETCAEAVMRLIVLQLGPLSLDQYEKLYNGIVSELKR